MAFVFISYCRESQEKARSLAQDLEALGHEVWLDQELTGGQAWWNLILTKIQKCDIFAFLVEPDSLKSTACKREYSYGVNLGKSILPVLVADGVSIDLLPAALAQIQFVDYRREDREALRGLAKALSALPPSPSLPDPLPEPPAAPVSYLGSLREQLEGSEILSFEQQTGLVLRLKHGLGDAKDAQDVRTLLRLFRSRDDLYARVADEIDSLLGSLIAPVAPQPSPKQERATNYAVPPSTDTYTAVENPRVVEPATATKVVGHKPSPFFLPFSLRELWLALGGGLLIDAALKIHSGYLLLKFPLSWSLPAAVLLSAIVIWKTRRRQPFAWLFILLPIVAVCLIQYASGFGGYYYFLVPREHDLWQGWFLEVLIPMATLATVLRPDSRPSATSSSISAKVVWFSLGISLAISALVSRTAWHLVLWVLQAVLAGAFAICVLVMLGKTLTRRQTESG